MKIVKSAKNYTETAEDEIKLLEKIAKVGGSNKQFVVELHEWFRITGVNGTHICMTFQVLGGNLLSLIKKYDHRGIPVHIVKRITKQIALGLDYLHRECGIIHTDLKPENILCEINIEETLKKFGLDKNFQVDKIEEDLKLTPKQRKRRREKEKKKILGSVDPIDGDHDMEVPIKNLELSDNTPRGSETELADLEHAHQLPPTPKSPRKLPLPRPLEDTGSFTSIDSMHYEPKAIEKGVLPATEAHDLSDETIRVKVADLGNACWTHTHFTEDIQTRQYRSPEAILGLSYDTSTDIWSFGCVLFELLTGDFLFYPKDGSKYSKNDGKWFSIDHIAQMIELLGDFPKVMFTGKHSSQIFNKKGQLKRINKLRYWNLEQVLQEKYEFSNEESTEIASVILPMIKVAPKERFVMLTRITARDSIKNDWFKGIMEEFTIP